MLWPLIYYLVGVLTYILLYAYYRNNLRKKSVELDFLKNLEEISTQPIIVVRKKPFETIKTEIEKYFYFNQIQIIFGIDFSASNEWKGRLTFNGQSLHRIQGSKIVNPYQKAIAQLGPSFEEIFQSKIKYSCFGFGDQSSEDFTFFPIVGTGDEFSRYNRILDAYLEQTNNVTLGGPTSFVPMLEKLISYGIHSPRDLTMLIILTDEPKFSHQNKIFLESILILSSLPNTCLVIIGVGDGPWHRISYEEHSLRNLVSNKRKLKKTSKRSMIDSKVTYDNFHFVHYNSTLMAQADRPQLDNLLVRAVLTKLPTQLKKAFENEKRETHF